MLRPRPPGSADARDVTQIVLTKLTVRLRRFQYDRAKSFRGFLRKVVNNALDDALRAGRENGPTGRGRVVATLSDPDARESLVAGVEQEFDLELLELATESVRERVEPRTLEAYRLTALEGFSGAEAAARLKMRVSAVYEAKSRVLGMLKDEIQRCENRPPRGEKP